MKPETVIAWRRRKFREYWTNLSRSGEPGRPKVAKVVRDLIRQMSVANPLWGSPHIVGELKKIGITLSVSTVDLSISMAACIITTSASRPEAITPLLTWINGIGMPGESTLNDQAVHSPDLSGRAGQFPAEAHSES